MRRFDAEERRRRLGRRHGLAAPLPTTEAVAEALVVLHATDPATVYLSALARLAEPTLAEVAAALYERRSLVRVLAMRRTLFVVPVELLGAVEVSSSVGVAATERKNLYRYLGESGVEDPEAWLAAAHDAIEAALAEAAAAGQGLTARQITAAAPALQAKVTIGAGSKFAVTTGATSRVLGLMAVEGHLMRGRTTGSWTTRTYQWHLRQAWLDDAAGPAAARVAAGRPAHVERHGLDPMTASAELVGRWLRAFGPAPLDDLRWWTGWTARQTRDALARLEVAEVDVDGTPGLALADDLEPEGPVAPWAALLPALDPTPMGWKQRDWYLGPHREPLFDRSGNIGPTVWVDGRIVGGWAHRPDGSIAVRLLEDVGADHRALIDARAAVLEAAVSPTVVKPSFPTPLYKELAAG